MYSDITDLKLEKEVSTKLLCKNTFKVDRSEAQEEKPFCEGGLANNGVKT